MMPSKTRPHPGTRTAVALALCTAMVAGCGDSGSSGPDLGPARGAGTGGGSEGGTSGDAGPDTGGTGGGGGGTGTGTGTGGMVMGTGTGTGGTAVERPAGFEDASAELPTRRAHGDDYGALWSDFDGDGRPDLLFMGHSLDPFLIGRQPDGGFVDRTTGDGLRTSADPDEYFQQGDRHGGSCADFDNDGLTDLFIGHGAYKGETLGVKFDELLKGRGDFTFEDVSKRAVPAGGLINSDGRGRTGAWADYDNDGFVDLYVTNFDSTNAMYRNNGDGTFSDVTATTGLGIVAFRAAWSDFDQDGNVDLLVTSPLRLMRNTGSGSFEDVTKRWTGEQDLFGYGLAWADLDSDGDQDFVVSARSYKVYAFMNLGDRFERLASAPFAAAGDLRVNGITPADVDNDGDIDLVQNTSAGLSLFLNDGAMRYTLSRLSRRPLQDLDYTHGDIAMADYDGDGLLDFATDDVEGYRLYRNSAANANHWLQVRLDGAISGNNAMGFGAKVRVSVDGVPVGFREHTGSSAGLRSFGCTPVHLGLGAHERVDVDVTWPNGHVSSLRNVDADRTIVVSE